MEFAGRLAVVTGGATGMGRELVLQLSAEGCSVALCDVSNEAQVQRFRDEVVEQQGRDHINLLFNNAGLAGGGSFVVGKREEWEKCFGVCWGGVYNCSRAFVPLLVASDQGYIVNTSSVNGFWASLGPGIPHTAYSSAKFAVKGFTEALMEDFKVNAPHVQAAVVMPGHIGTDIVLNTRKLQGLDPNGMTAEEIAEIRASVAQRGIPLDGVSDEDLAKMVTMMGESFRDNAPTSAAQAATIILDAVKANQWRILVGDDAVALDEAVRSDPERAYAADGPTLSSITAFGPQ